MNLPDSFLGARCDILMDIVVISLALIVPILWYSLATVKKAKNYKRHKNIQLYLGLILLVVVVLFELDMRFQGGIFEMVKGSRYEDTAFMNFSVYFHTFLAISTSMLWVVLIPLSLIKYGRKNPEPGRFSRVHKPLGWIGMILMLLTGITGVELYFIGFVF